MKELQDIVRNLDAEDVIPVWNEVCDKNCYEDYLYNMYDFEDIEGDSFKSIFPRLMPDFSLDDDYFWLYNGNIYSGDASSAVNEMVDWGILIDYVNDHLAELDIDDDDFQEYKEQVIYSFFDDMEED